MDGKQAVQGIGGGMKRYEVQLAPEWCVSCLSYDMYAASAEVEYATIDRLCTEGIHSYDVTEVHG